MNPQPQMVSMLILKQPLLMIPAMCTNLQPTMMMKIKLTEIYKGINVQVDSNLFPIYSLKQVCLLLCLLFSFNSVLTNMDTYEFE